MMSAPVAAAGPTNCKVGIVLIVWVFVGEDCFLLGFAYTRRVYCFFWLLSVEIFGFLEPKSIKELLFTFTWKIIVCVF